MEEEGSAPAPSRKELRKKKLMEYLSAKGKIKLLNPKHTLDQDCQVKKPLTSEIQIIKGKENKAPDSIFVNNDLKGPILTESRVEPIRKCLGITSRGNVKGQKDSARPSSTLVATQPKLNPALIRTYTIRSSKSSLNLANQLKNQPSTEVPSSARATINVFHGTKVKSNPKFGLTSRPAWSDSLNTRLSNRPLVKTRTGLIAAVTQQRSTKSDSSRTFDSAFDKNPSQKGNPVSNVSVSQSRRDFCHSGSRQRQNKTSLQPPLKKPPESSSGYRPSNTIMSTSSVFKCTVAPRKSSPRIHTSLSTGMPVKRYCKPKSEQGGMKESCRVVLQSSSKLANSSRTTGPQAATPEPAKKTKTGIKFKNSSANVKAGAKSLSSPSTSQSMLPHVRLSSLSSRASQTKTKKIPGLSCTEEKKPTAAQEERLRKLQEWRETRGISYKRPPMPLKPSARCKATVPLPFWESLKEEDKLISALDRCLEDCIKLLQEGCPLEQARRVLSGLPPLAHRFAKYWICLVYLKEREGERNILPLFEEAVRVVLEPVDELRTVVFEILKKTDKLEATDHITAAEEEEAAGTSSFCSNEPLKTPKLVRAIIWGQDGDSSVVKYKITNTPGGSAFNRSKEASRVNGKEVRFFTPVRRSVRIQRASLHHPPSLQDHDVCIASYSELEDSEEPGQDYSPSDAHTPIYVYRENEALKEQVFVQLVHEDSG